MRKLFSLVSYVLLSSCAFAWDVAFTNESQSAYASGVPRGWRLDDVDGATWSMLTPQPRDPASTGEKGLGFGLRGCKGTKILCTTNSVIQSGEVLCDKVFAHVRVYMQAHDTKYDSLQLVISTDNWKTRKEIGNPIRLEEKGRTIEWMTVERTEKIPGLRAAATNGVSVGVLVTASGSTMRYAYLKSIDLQFVASATPLNESLGFEVDGVKVETLSPGATNAYVVATIDEYPTNGIGKVLVKRTYCVWNRNGEIRTNDMERIGSSMCWRSKEFGTVYREFPAVDAGERISARVFTEYGTDPEDFRKLGEPTETAGIVWESSGEVNIEVSKKGSVWINEFAPDKIELCGTTNRVMLSGWMLELSNSKTNFCADLPGEFCFTNNMINGVVGIETRELRWKDADGRDVKDLPSGSYTLRLLNSACIPEHEQAINLPLENCVGMVGYARWYGAGYDWSGTSTSDWLTWGKLSTNSFGAVNYPEQGFKVPVDATLKVGTGTFDDEGGTNLSYVTVIATVYGFDNDESAVAAKNISTQSVNGVALIPINGYSATPEKIFVDLAVSAFGWVCDPTSLDASNGCTTVTGLRLSPTVAFDDFEGGAMAPYWNKDQPSARKWRVSGGSLQVQRSSSKATAILPCLNFLSPRGRKRISVSFDYVNFYSTSPNADYFYVQITTNSTWTGQSNASPSLSDKRKDLYQKYGNKDLSYKYHTTFDLHDEFSNSNEIWVRLVSESDGSTSKDITVDNLRIAFEDVAIPTNLMRTVESPVSGGSTGFVLDVLPQTTDKIEEVSADLHISVDGDEKIVPFAFADGTLTNRISIADGDGAPSLPSSAKLTISPEALEKVCGKFYAGQTVKYYAAVHYNSANGDTDQEGYTELEGLHQTRYFPDNAKIETIEATEGTRDYWVVEGAYKAIEDQSYEFTVDGPDIEILGTPEIGANEIAFDYHAWDGDKGKSITNLTVTVVADGYSTNHVMYAGEATNRVMNAFVVPGLDANTEYTFTLSGQRSTGRDLTPTNYTFVTLPVLNSAKIDGISTTDAKLTVSGQAAGYVVTPDTWKAEPGSATTWTWGNGSPDSEFTATVYATNKVGVASVATNTVSGYTLAAVAKGMPKIEKVVNEVKVQAPAGYVAGDDENPSDTEYTIRVVTSSGKTNDVNQWQTLADWATPVMVGYPDLDLEATNNFWFITRNHDGIVTGNDKKDATTNCWFELVADITNVVQKADPFGTVDVALKFFDPARKEATATVQYKFDEKGGWTNVCNPFEVQFVDFTAGTNLSWNARAAVESSFAETDWNTNHVYSLRVQLTAGPRTSEWMVKDGCEVDFEKPKVDEFKSDVPAAFNKSPMKVTVKFSKQVVDFTADKVEVGNGTKGALAAGPDNTYTIDVTPTEQGEVTVQIASVKDRFGNESAATSTLTWTYDTEAPTWEDPAITGTPANGSATNGTGYALAAHATDNLTDVVYHWSFNQQNWEDGAEFAGDVEDGEKEYTVYVYATDAAGNVSTTNEWSWTYDTTPPLKPVISGTPANGSHTNEAHYALTAHATDNLTEIAYHWTLKHGEETTATQDGATFCNSVEEEGDYTAYVYATDAAGNVSETNSWSWTYDKTPPSKPAISGKPAENGSATKDPEYELQAESTEDVSLPIAYRWTLKRGDEIVSTGVSATFGGSVTEDDVYRAGVFAVDAAGNVSETNFWNWTVDRHAPTNLVITGTPMSNTVTNVKEYNLSASAEDLTVVTFHWTLDGENWTEVTNFSDEVTADGSYTAQVYAQDRVGNVSVTNSWSWTVDTTWPTVTLTSETLEPFNTAQCPWKLTATFSEPVTNFTENCVTVHNGTATRVTKSDGDVYTIEVTPGEDGEVSVQIAEGATGDPAGNPNKASVELKRTYDTQAPELQPITGTPADGAVTNEPPFDLTGHATDNLTTITYHWLTNGVWAADVTNFVGEVKAEGTYVMSVYATDAAGNGSATTNTVTWTFDETAPTNLVVTGEPANGAFTRMTSFSLKAMAMDLTETTVYWTFDNGQEVSTKTNEVFARSGISDGPHTVKCHALDEAGNKSASTNWTWTVDTVQPGVTLASESLKPFNLSGVPWRLTAEFTEPVTNFTVNCVKVHNGTATKVEKSQGNAYTIEVTPSEDGEVSVWIAEGATGDPAGNTNKVSNTLKRIYDTEAPELADVTGTPADGTITNNPAFNFDISLTKDDLTTVTYHWLTNDVWAADVTNYTGTVAAEGAYVMSVYATDEAGNVSETNSVGWTYDRTPPSKPAFTDACRPRQGSITNDRTYEFGATSQDDCSTPTCHWKKSWSAAAEPGSEISGELGENDNGDFWVEVWAVDVAGNVSETNRLSWTLDQVKPELQPITGTPADGTVTNKPPFDLTGHAEEDLTTITYHWLTNGVWAADVTNFVGEVRAEGTYVMSVYATDAAGNGSATTNTVTWTFDETAPTNLVVTGEPANGAFTRMTSFSLKAMAMDLTEPTVYWTFDNGQEVSTKTNEVFARSGISDGPHTVKCHAVDEAGNRSASTNWTWTVDTQKPVVTIAPDGVGEVTYVDPIPFKVTVTDKTGVTPLSKDDFEITAEGVANLPTISDFVNVEGGNTNYTFNLSSPDEALTGPVVIQLKLKNPVEDSAGNKSALAEYKVTSDRTKPTVVIATKNAVSTNNAASIDYTMSVRSFSPITNDLALADIRVPARCSVTAFAGVEPTNDRGCYTNYAFTVSTRTTDDTLMDVWLPEKKVFNSAANFNVAAHANPVMSDHTAPMPVVTCTAFSLTNNLAEIPFAITVVETNGLSTSLSSASIEVVSENGTIKNFGGSGLNYSFDVTPNGNAVGEIKVKVNAGSITDFAGNSAVESQVVSVVSDRTPPTAALSTATDLTRARNEATIDFTVTLADSQDHLSAESNYLSTASFVPGNYTVDSVTGKGKTYTATIRPTADGPVSVGVKADAFCDLAGNGNSASAVANFVCDRTAPTIAFDGQNTAGRHFEMKVSATDTPETTKDIEYKWSVVGSGQTFGADWTTTETNKEVTLRGTGLNDGAWNWMVQFRDVAGNIATTNGSWTVKTDEAPELELTPTSGTVNGSATEPLVFTLRANGDLKLTKALNPDMVHHVSRDQVFYRQVVAIAGDSEATITLTPVKQDRDFTDVVTLTIPCGAATGTNGIAAATLSGTVTYKFSGTNTNPETVRIVRTAVGYLDDPHRTNENLGEITLFAKTVNGAKFAQGLTKASITGASVKSVAVAADGLSAEITLTADAQRQLVDIDGWKGFNLVFAGGSVESLPSPIAAGTPVTVSVKVWRNLARVAGANGAAVKVDGKDAPLAHDGDARTAQVEGSAKLSATFPRARVNSVHIRLSAASAKAAYRPTQATVTLKSAGKTVETFVTDLVWDGKRCAPVDLLVTPQDTLVAEAIADEAELSFTGSTAALYLDEFAVFGIPEAVDPLCPEILSVNPVEGGFVVRTDMGVSNWVKSASQTLELESEGALSGVGIDWANIDWADAAHMALKVPVSGQANAGYVGGVTLRVREGFLSNFIGRSNVCETISTSNIVWNSGTAPAALSFTRYGGTGESVAFGADALSWELILNQPVLNLSGESFNKHAALGAVQVLGTDSPTNYIVRAQLNCWTNAVSDVTVTLKGEAIRGLTGKSNADAKSAEAYSLEEVKVIE